MPTSKNTFVAHCKQVMLEYTRDKKLIVNYIRERPRRTRSGARPTSEEAKQIRRFLNAAPSLTPRGYIAMLGIQGIDTKDREEELIEKFLVARSFWRSMRTPRVGCVIAFNQPDTGLHIGWSLCRVRSNGSNVDTFNRWIGIHEALKVAVPEVRHPNTTTVLADLIHQTETTLASYRELRKASPQCAVPETPIPHTLLPYVKEMMVRAKKLYAPKEAKEVVGTA